MNLTERQQEVLDYISHMQATVGVMPSTREIQEHFGFASQTAAVNHLRALEKKGMIHRQPGKARAVAVVSQLRRERIVDVPVYGSIAAGFAETAEQQEEGTISIDAATLGLGRSKACLCLQSARRFHDRRGDQRRRPGDPGESRAAGRRDRGRA